MLQAERVNLQVLLLLLSHSHMWANAERGPLMDRLILGSTPPSGKGVWLWMLSGRCLLYSPSETSCGWRMLIAGEGVVGGISPAEAQEAVRGREGPREARCNDNLI